MRSRVWVFVTNLNLLISIWQGFTCCLCNVSFCHIYRLTLSCNDCTDSASLESHSAPRNCLLGKKDKTAHGPLYYLLLTPIREVFSYRTKREGMMPLLWLVRLLSPRPSCLLLTLQLIVAVRMRHDDHSAGGTCCNCAAHVSCVTAIGTRVTLVLPGRALFIGV